MKSIVLPAVIVVLLGLALALGSCSDTSPTATVIMDTNQTCAAIFNPNILPWIQVTGDVHSQEGIYTPGGP